VAGWCVYMLRCGDGTLYTGATCDLPSRLSRHRRGTGARYTRGRGPLLLVYAEPCESRSAALSREYALKQLTRVLKQELCAWSIASRA